jgi:predicted RNase H-like HicB family nuclease
MVYLLLNAILCLECHSLPGCISQGNSRKEVLENIQDAIKGYLESLRKHDEPVPYVIPMKMGIQS